MKSAALLVVDCQADFLDYVASAVVIRLPMGIVRIAQDMSAAGWWTYTLGRKNRRDAPFFKSRGGRWVDHCMEDTRGGIYVVSVGWICESSSAPEESLLGALCPDDGHRPLGESLRRNSIRRLAICGLGTEYGIRSTALEALKKGFKVDVITDLCEAYNIESPNDGIDAILDMEDAGARLLTSSEVVHGVARLVDKHHDDDGVNDDDR